MKPPFPKSGPQMITLRSCILYLVTIVSSALALEWSELPFPASPDSITPSVASAPDGNIYVSWIAPADGNQHTLWVARYDRELASWLAPVQIATGSDWFLNWADTPTVAAGLRGRVAATWPVLNETDGYHTMTSVSEDHGATWSSPQPLTTESNLTEFVSLASLTNGTWLAVWLDARDRAQTGAMQLRSRVLGTTTADLLVDDRVCDCCPISTLVLPNGAVLTAYRDRSPAEIRDIVYQNYSRGKWTPATPPERDEWHTTGCPVNGARLSRRSGHVATAWFTGANETPQVLTARSNNLGRTWNHVARIDDPHHQATGHVSSAVLRDGSQWVSWVETSGTLALRSLQRDGSLSPITRMPGTGTGNPKMVVLANRSDQPAQLLVVRSETDGVKTHVATLPENPDAVLDDCGCGPSDEDTRGHPVKGTIVSLLPDRDALLVAHEEVPGVMMAMTMAFQVDRRVLKLVEPGQDIIARMERRDDGKWWLFNLRIIATSD